MACDKVPFTQREAGEALSQAVYLRSRGDDKRAECRSYWCAECRAFHLTKQPERRKQTLRPAGVKNRYLRRQHG